MAGNAPAPWHSSSLAYVAGATTEHTYTVKLWGGNLATGAMVAVPAWDVNVTLDATKVPYGEATFKTPPPPWGTSWDGTFPSLTVDRAPIYLCPVEIRAGWRHLIDGVMTDDQQTLLYGYVTETEELTKADGTRYVQWKVVTADQLWEYPSHRTYDVSDSFTQVKQVADAWAAAADPWYVDPVVVNGTLNSPSSGQLASFRSCDIGIGDSVGDFFRTIALTLGQRCLPDHRATALRWKVAAEPTYDTANKLTLPSAYEVTKKASTENGFATILNLKCLWFSAGEQKTTQRTFPSIALGGLDPTRGIAPAVARDVTIYQKPPGGTIPTDPNWGPAAAWIARATNRSLVTYKVTSRAAWWLQPYDVVTYTAAGVTVNVDAITFHLDAGTMTVTGFKS